MKISICNIFSKNNYFYQPWTNNAEWQKMYLISWLLNKCIFPKFYVGFQHELLSCWISPDLCLVAIKLIHHPAKLLEHHRSPEILRVHTGKTL